MDSTYLGRQPILDRQHQLMAYELLFRSGLNGSANVEHAFAATATVIVNAFVHLGIPEVLGSHKGFVNVDEESLMSEGIELLPHQQVVLELLESVPPTRDVIERCRHLRGMGFRIALDDVTAWDQRAMRLAEVADIVKIDVLAASPAAVDQVLAARRGRPLLMLAEKVDSQQMAARCMEQGFDLFQGYFFARPQVMSGRRIDPGKLALVKLMKLVMADAAPAQVEEAIKPHPTLTFNLLRLVNSVAFGMSRKITSLRQAVVILGQRQLRRWVQLLMYAGNGKDAPLSNPLMHLAATRGKLMELVAAKTRPGDIEYCDEAFIVGILSLSEALLNVPMADIVKELNLSAEIGGALTGREGPLGLLLRLQELLEANTTSELARALAQEPSLSLNDLVSAQLEAIGWANSLGEAAA